MVGEVGSTVSCEQCLISLAQSCNAPDGALVHCFKRPPPTRYRFTARFDFNLRAQRPQHGAKASRLGPATGPPRGEQVGVCTASSLGRPSWAALPALCLILPPKTCCCLVSSLHEHHGSRRRAMRFWAQMPSMVPSCGPQRPYQGPRHCFDRS